MKTFLIQFLSIIIAGSSLLVPAVANTQGRALGELLRNSQGGSMRTTLESGTGNFNLTFPAISGQALVNSNGLTNLRPGTTASELRFFNQANTFYTGLRAGASTANAVFTLPLADGAAGQLLTTNGSGQLGWVNAPTVNANFWSLTGNSGTTTTSNFIGTTDNVGLAFRTSNTQRMVITDVGRVGIGVATPNNNLVVLDNMEIQRNPSTAISSLIFSNTSGTGDFRISSDGGDIFWQGGGARNLQMGSYHAMILAGDRQVNTALPHVNASAATVNTNVLIQGQRSVSVPLAIQGATGVTANLTEWRSPANALMNVVNASGNLGLGNSAPTEKLDVTGNLKFSGALLPGGAAGTTGQVLVTNGAGTAPSWATVANATTAWMQSGNTLTGLRNFGTLSNHDLPFITGGTEGMRLTTSNKLGLGLSAIPKANIGMAKFAIEGTNASINGPHVQFTTSTDNYPLVSIMPWMHDNSFITFDAYHNGTNWYSSTGVGGNFHITKTGGRLSINYANNNVAGSLIADNAWKPGIVLNNAGNVGIGSSAFNATNPEELLIDAGASNSHNLIHARGTVNNYLQFNIQNLSNGSGASTDIVATADNGTETTNFIDMGINSSTYTGGTFGGANDAYLYNVGQDLLIGTGSLNRSLKFLTGGVNENTNTRMVIDGTGSISVYGQLAPVNDAQIYLGRSTLRWHTVYSANGTVQTSDIRYKTNISKLAYGLKEVLAMNPIQYNWKTDPNANRKVGLVAQEVQKLVPEVVTGEPNSEPLAMNYAELVPVLVNAIKEQQAQIDDLKKEISNLKKNK